MSIQARTSSAPTASAALRRRLADAFASGKSVQRYTLASEEAQALIDAGRITFQIGALGKGFSVHCANLSKWTEGDGDLRRILLEYLADVEVPDAYKRAARTVIRFFTDAPEQCSENTLLTEASRVGAEGLFGLAAAVEAKATTKGLSGQSRRNYKATAGKLVRYGAERHLVPLLWPATKIEDAWEEVASAIPVADAARSLLRTCRPFFLDILGVEGADPRTLTKEQVETVCRTLRSRGQYREARIVAQTITRAAKYSIEAGDVGEATLAITWPSEKGPPLSTPEGLIHLLRARGYPDSLVDAIQYHADVCVLSDDELAMKGDAYPMRRIRPRVQVTTFRLHIRRIRLLLGIAEARAKWAPSEITPTKIFSSIHVLIAHLKQNWEHRASKGLITGPATGDLGMTIYTWGMVAETLRGKAEHERTRLADDPNASGADIMATARTEALLTRARDTAYKASEGVRERIENSPKGSANNTSKDIKEVYDRTPPTYWFRTLRAMCDAVEKNRRANRCDIDALLLEQMTFITALILATGMRWAEVCHVRLDLQFTPELRLKNEITLRAIDRKNETRHTVSLPSNVLPRWLLSDFLLRVRPILLKTHDHPWLVVRRSGRPVGCEGESLDGETRDLLAYENRRANFRNLWKDIVAPFAYAANGSCPAEDGQFTPHCIRNVVAAEIVKRHGIDKAAHWLGDHPNSVRDTYGFLEGRASEIESVTNDVLAEIAATE